MPDSRTPGADSPFRRSWHPSPLIRASVALHVGAAVVTLARTPLWPWSLGAVVANHLLLTAAGLWPRSRLLGPNWTHLPGETNASPSAIAVTIDDGPDPEVTPRVLDCLDQHGAKATFFGVGERVEAQATLAREIVRRGHALENHTYRHLVRFSLLGPRGLREEIHLGQETIASATGQVPWFFRAPAGLRNPFLEAVLAEESLGLVSWTRRGWDTLSRSPERVLERLTRGLIAGDILALHDGRAARTRSGDPVILEVLPRLLAALSAAGLTAVTLRAAFAPATAPERAAPATATPA